MTRLLKLTPRQILIVLHDLVATVAAIVLTFLVRFDESPATRQESAGLELFLPFFVLYAAAVYFIFDLHRNKWRFTSVPDLYNIVRASTVLAVSLLALDYVLLTPNFYGTFFFGKITILLYWLLQMFFLGGSRVAYRYFHYARTLQRAKIADAAATLLLGRAADAEVLLRSIESGAVKKVWPVGVLSPAATDRGQSIRGIPVLGDIDDLERVVADLAARDTRVTRLVLTPSAFSPDARPEAILMRARRLGLNVSQLPSLEAGRARGAAGAGRGRRPVAAAERQDRLSAARGIRQRQVDRGHRWRWVDRLGNLRPYCRLRRRPAAGDREFRTRPACRHGSAGGQAERQRIFPAASPISAIARASCI